MFKRLMKSLKGDGIRFLIDKFKIHLIVLLIASASLS